jgi:hypothetical protein
MAAASRRRTLSRWSTAIAIVAMIAFFGPRMLRKSSIEAASPEIAAVTALVPLIPYASLELPPLQPDRQNAAGITLSRDPFQSVVEPAATGAGASARASVAPDTGRREQSVVVSAILISDSRRAAVINDVLVNVGGEVPGGGKLTSVEHDRVVVTDAKGIRRTITINTGTQ